MLHDGKRVLIMEADLPLALDWKRTFELNKCEVVVTSNAYDALTVLETETFDLVVTDLVLPERKGLIQLLGKLFMMGKTAPAAIAIVGSENKALDGAYVDILVQQANRLGASVGLQAPFPPGELVAHAFDIWTDREALLAAA